MRDLTGMATEPSEPRHHECPRCDTSIWFDEEAQVCGQCEWGLDGERAAECDSTDRFTVDMDSDEDARNAAHTVLSRLNQIKEANPDATIGVEIELTPVTRNEPDI